MQLLDAPPTSAPAQVSVEPSPRRLRTAWALAYAVPVGAAVAASLQWFSPGRFIAAGDVSPLLRDPAAAEIGWLWTHQTTGAGSSSTEIARAFEVGLVWLASVVGGTDLLAQRLLYAIILGAAAFGVSFFAGALTRRPLLVAGCGMLGAFTPLVLISNFNPVLLTPLGLLGVLCGLLLRAGRGDNISGATLALASLGLSYIALNPPALAVAIVSTVGVAVAASLFVGRGGTRRAVSLLVRAAPLGVAVNLWWMVPVGLALFGPSGAAIAAETDVTQWAWTHAHNSVWDVAALNAHWTWRFPEYLPAAALLDHPAWVWMRYVLPAGALSAPLLVTRDRRGRAAAVAGVALALIFIGKGLHAPLGEVNAWLYGRVPGFWLLREPLNKIGPLLLLCYIALFVWLVESVEERIARRTLGIGARGVVAAAVCASLVYPWPLYTGDIAPAQRDPLPGVQVAVPDGWRQAAAAVNADPAAAKSLVLPLNPYYQMTTDWGYHGVDTVAQQLINRPVIQRLPGGYFSETGGFDGLLDAVERSLIDGDVAGIPRLLQSLAVSHVLIRNDLLPGQSGRPFADQRRLAEVAHRTPGLDFVGDYGVVSVFRATAPYNLVAAYQQTASIDGAGGDAHGARVLQRLPQDTAATAGGGTGSPGASGVLVEGADGGTRFKVGAAGTYVVARESDGTLWDVHSRPGVVRLDEEVEVQVDGAAVTDARSITVPVSDESLVVALPATMAPGDPNAVSIITGEEQVRLPRGGRLAALEPSESTSLYPAGPVGDCNAHDARAGDETALTAHFEGERVQLSARAHSACVTASIPAAGDASLYQLKFDARSREGLPARLCVWDPAVQECIGQTTVQSRGWASTSMVVATTGREPLEVFLYADGPDDGGRTTTAYRRMAMRRYSISAIDTIDVPEPGATAVDLSAGSHDVAVRQAVEASLLAPLSPVSDCQRTDQRTLAEVGVAAEEIDGGVRLRAREHSACVSAQLPPGELSDRYLLEFEHRTIAGVNARVCLWQTGPDRCSVMPDLDSGPDWSTFRFPVRPLPGARGLAVYFYADGDSGRETVTEYRNIALAPALSTFVAVTPPAPAGAIPAVAGSRKNPAAYSVEVERATGPFVLTLAESFDSGWALDGLPSTWTAEHTKVDGYANAWILRPLAGADTAFSVAIEHQPSAWARRALYVSGLGGGVALLVLLLRLGRRLRARRGVQRNHKWLLA